MTLIATLLQDADTAVLRGDIEAAGRLYAHVREQEPGNADAWNGMGAVHFERGELEESLRSFEKAMALVEGRAAKKFPANKPTLRALRGIGLNFFRMGRETDARDAFMELLAKDPDDHMGARFLLEDLRKGKKLWPAKKSL